MNSILLKIYAFELIYLHCVVIVDSFWQVDRVKSNIMYEVRVSNPWETTSVKIRVSEAY